MTNKTKGIGNKIKKAASKARSAVNRAKSKVKTFAKKVSSRVKSAVKRGISKIAAKARSIKNSAAKKVKSITKKVKSFAKNVKNKVNHVIAKSKKTISKAVQKVKTATKRYATYVRSSLQKGYQKAKQSVKSAINLVKKGPKAAAKALGNKMKQAWNDAKKHASNSWNTVKNAAKKVINHPAAQRFTKGALGIVQIAGGLVQVGAGAVLSTTGLGLLLGVPMAAHGAADVWQGFASTINAIAGKQVIPEVNFMQEAYKAAGRWIGEKTIGAAKGEAIANYVFTIADLGLGFINAGKLAAQLKHVKDLSKLEQLKYLKVQYITQPFQTLKGKAVNVTKYGYSIVSKMSSGYNKAAKAAKNGFNSMLKGAKFTAGKGKTFAKSTVSKGKAVYKTAKANLIAVKEAVGAGFNHIGNKMVARVAMGVDPTLVIDGVKEGVKKYKEVKKVANKVTKGVSKVERLALPAPRQSSFNIGERLVSMNVYENYIKGQDSFRLGAPNANSFFFNKPGANQAIRSYEAAVNAGFTYQNIADTVQWGGNELVRIRFKLDKIDSITVPGVSKIPNGVGDGVIPGTNELFTGKGWTQNYLGQRGYDEFIGSNVRLSPEDIIDVKYLGRIRK